MVWRGLTNATARRLHRRMRGSLRWRATADDLATNRTMSGAAMTTLIVEVFRLNGRLLAAGDRLVAGLGLTRARIPRSPTPEPVAHRARDMGFNRRGPRRIVNELAKEDIVAFQENPRHRRANSSC
jgi:hypothetical protein